MSQTNMTRLLDAVEAHVVFDGWSDAAFAAAVEDSGLSMDEARLACPRGAVDLAVAYHKAGDAEMSRRLAEIDLGAKRYRDRVALAIQFRLEVVDREMVRRGMTLFSLPHMAPEGARLMWGTADAIWAALGDTSQDYNWYSKRAILSGVYGSCVLYWLGDETGGEATSAFIDRRIDDVMQFEKFKGQMRANPVTAPLAKGVERLLAGIKAPGTPPTDLPGRW